MKAGGAIWYVIAAVLVVAIGAYAVIATRKTRREQLQRSQERASAMMLALHQAAAESKAAAARNAAAANPPVPGQSPTAPVRPAATAPVPAAAVAAAVAPVPPAAAPALVLTRRARALTDPQRLLFLVLRAALPDHVVMPNLRIVDLLDLPADVAGAERDPRVAELSRQRLDFVVCNPGLEPVAAIVLHDGGDAAAASDRARIEALREFGVRYLRFRADSLPKPAEARSFILG